MTLSLKKLGLLALLFLLLFQIRTNGQSLKIYKVGQQVEHFSMFDYNSKKYSTKNVKEKKLIVMVFISNECPYLESAIKNIKSIQSTYTADIEIWAVNSYNININLNEDEEHMKLYAEKNQMLQIPYLVDLSQDVAAQFSVKQVPSAVLLKVGDDGIKFIYSGSVLETINGKQVNLLENNIAQVLKGKPVSTAKSKQKSCEIK